MTTTEPAPAAARPGRPPGQPTFSPYLAVSDGRAAIRYYTEAFGAVPDGPVVVAADGRIGHAQLRIGDATVMLADPWELPGVDNPTSLGATTVQLHLYVEDVDETYRRAVSAGGVGRRPPEDQPYGDRSGTVVDPFGHSWMLNTAGPVRSEAEMAEGFAAGGFRMAGVDELDDLGEPGDLDLGVRAPAPEPAPPASTDDIARLFYFTMRSPDAERSQAFFADLFGWRFAPGGHITNTAPHGGVAAGEEPGVDLFFTVPDIRAAVARVRALAGEADEPVHHESGWSAACRDPRGVLFHLSEPAPGYA
jgi:PhnB protein